MLDHATSFTMTLEEALRRSPEGTAYALSPEPSGGFVYCGPSRQPHTGAAPWSGDPETLKWRPTGGEERWFP
jgi:hypothetical protein